MENPELELAPSFDPDVFEYEAEIPSDKTGGRIVMTKNSAALWGKVNQGNRQVSVLMEYHFPAGDRVNSEAVFIPDQPDSYIFNYSFKNTQVTANDVVISIPVANNTKTNVYTLTINRA